MTRGEIYMSLLGAQAQSIRYGCRPKSPLDLARFDDWKAVWWEAIKEEFDVERREWFRKHLTR